MTAPEFDSYLTTAIPEYAQDKVASGQWHERASLGLARAGFNELLPQGLDTPDHFLFTLRGDAPAEEVGVLWFAVQDRGGAPIAYVYDIFIVPAQRKKGYATRAFEALEREVNKRGLSGIALHVFGHNTAAQALYAKLGFTATNISMFRPSRNDDA